MSAHEGRVMARGKLSADDLIKNFHLLRSHPVKYLALAQEFVRQNPNDPGAYFSRHWGWAELGRMDRALADLDRALSLEQHPVTYGARAMVLRAIGRHRDAIDDFNRAEALATDRSKVDFDRLFRADCHARLGDEKAALADCALLRDDHWTPGVFGAPKGNKQEVIAEIRRRAAAGRRAAQKRGEGPFRLVAKSED